MILEKFQIRSFDAKIAVTQAEKIPVPKGAIFLNKVKVLHDGIYAFYGVNSIILGNGEVYYDEYKILQPKEELPDDKEWRLVDILDVIFEVPSETQEGNENKAEISQGLMLFPIYRKIPKSNLIL